jgi:hypothetical protein
MTFDLVLVVELLSLVLLLFALFAARQYVRRRRLQRAGGRPGKTGGPRLSARTEMRAFDDSGTLLRTLDRGRMTRHRVHGKSGRQASARATR